jgi:SAM-dependent methyltransferase
MAKSEEDKMPENAIDMQVVSKQRVNDFGEVYTAKREIDAMLDLVKQETERIDSRFLEPACGTGSFLAEILERKLRVVEKRYARSQLEYERNAVLAVSSIYGIDILEDNVQQCRQRLFGIFNLDYLRLFSSKTNDQCRESVRFILERNIVHGDALTLKTVGEQPGYIVFSEWSPVNGSFLKRRDFTFHGLLEHESMKELPLFSDLGEDVFVPTPEKEYPLTHFLEIADADKQ